MSALLYRAEVGSHAYGTNTEVSDHDFVEVWIEDPEYITGLSKWDTEFKSNEGRTPVGGEDTTVYGFKKFMELVAQGNPNMIELLFIENSVEDNGYDHGYLGIGNPGYPWSLILANRYAFLSKSAGHRFLGYAQSQQFALMGVRNKRTNRPELVHTHGWDTKYAGHLIRVLGEGLELMKTGELQMPLNDSLRRSILAIRNGDVDKDDMLELANKLRVKLEAAVEQANLPDRADYKTINRLMHDVYGMVWSAN